MTQYNERKNLRSAFGIRGRVQARLCNIPLCNIFLFCLLLGAVWQSGIREAQAQRIVEVESGLARDAGYLIFRWQPAPSFSSQIDEQQNLRLTFSQSALGFELGDAQQKLARYLSSVRVQDTRRIVFALKPNVLVSTRRTEGSIVVYFQSDPASNTIPGQSVSVERTDSVPKEAFEQGEERQATPFQVALNSERRAGYDRLSFAWPSDVLFRARITADPDSEEGEERNLLVVEFSKPLVIANAAARMRSIARSLGNPTFVRNGLEVRFALKRNLSMRDFAYGNRVVIDLFARDQDDSSLASRYGVEASTVAPAAPRLPAISVRAGRHGDYTRFIFDYDKPTNYLVEKQGQRLVVTFNRANPLDLRTLELTQRGFFSPVRVQRFADRALFSVPLRRNNRYRHFVSGTRVVLDLFHVVEVDATPLPDLVGISSILRQTSAPLPPPRIFSRSGSAPGDAQPSPTRIASTRPTPAYQFQLLLPEDISTAFFQRAGYIWFVADRAFTFDTQQETQNAQSAIGDIEQLDVEGFTVLRFSSTQRLYPALRRVGLGWWLEFHDQPVPPYFSIDTAITQDAQEQAEFNFLLNRYGKIATIQDPEIGDNFHVIPVPTPSLGIARARAYPEFQILESAQGIALVPLASDLKVQPDDGYVTIKAPKGLRLETLDVDRAVAERAPDELIRLPVLNFSLWERDGSSYDVERQKFNARSLRDLSASRRGFNLTLAGYYLSQGLGHEALGLLNLYEQSFPTNNLTPRLMRALALLLSERADEAIQLLRAPVFDRLQEAYLWRGVAAAQKEQWSLAESYFAQAGNFYDLYPPAIKAFVSVWRTLSALNNDNTSAATVWLRRAERLPSSYIRRSNRDAFQFLKGWLARSRGNDRRAFDTWQGMQSAKQRGYWQVRAALEALVLAKENDILPSEKILEQLGRLNQAWRGDALAFRVRRELGNTYGLNGLYYQQLRTYREAITRHPLLPETAELSQQMVDLFQDLFLLREAVTLSPVEAYLLYQGFKELIPPGELGLLLSESAVERISQGSFYKIAADIAKKAFIEDNSAGDKDRLVAKTGLLLLLARQPQEALSVLNRNIPSEGSPYRDDARRLRARALVELGQQDYALELLAGDISEPADLLRFLIHRTNAEWGDAASALQRLLGPPPRQEGVRLSQRKASFLLYLAASLYLAGETDALDGIARDYAETIDGSPLLEVFNFLTQLNDPQQPVSVATLLERLQEGEDTNLGFLDLYQQRFLR